MKGKVSLRTFKGRVVMVGSASLCCHPWTSTGQLRPSEGPQCMTERGHTHSKHTCMRGLALTDAETSISIPLSLTS